MSIAFVIFSAVMLLNSPQENSVFISALFICVKFWLYVDNNNFPKPDCYSGCVFEMTDYAQLQNKKLSF